MATDVMAEDVAVGPPPPRARDLALWFWRQLTSMRVALVLLFLLAVASVPGSVFPQRRTNPIAVSAYFDDHPDLAPWLDRLSMFGVFGSPWFGAIYVLLFVSLVGCVVPRSFAHARALRNRPPAVPRHLTRMRDHRSVTSPDPREAVLDAASAAMRKRHYRMDRTATTISAERGYLRETGNLLFHLSLLLLIVGAGVGGLFGTRGTVVVLEGEGFTNTATQYDDLSPGRLLDESDLPPFSLELLDFSATYATEGERRGAADSFDAEVRYQAGPGQPSHERDIRVNHPLTIGRTDIHLLGHGYAPRFTVTDGAGEVVFAGPVPFLPQDANFLSTGVVKVPDAQPEQLGFSGFFLPTAVVDDQGPRSLFPAALNPAVVLNVWKGDVGMDSGRPQSVYQLDTSSMEQVRDADGQIVAELLVAGQTLDLPDGLGSITYDGYVEWANLQVSSNPGLPILLGGAVLALVGVTLSLFIRRRRIWVRVGTTEAGDTVVELAGLDRAHGGDLDAELDELATITGSISRSETGTKGP
jgi:cytochrome c biogenesis protein